MRLRHLIAAIVIVLAGTSCDHGNPLSPTPSSGSPLVHLSTIALSGPQRLQPGEVGQYKATATYSDGSIQDVTGTASWSSLDSNPRNGIVASHEVLAVSPGGSVKSLTVGQAVVYASVDQRRSAPYEVDTYAEGTFAVWGSVTDDGNPLHASVEVVAGTRSGLFVFSNESRGFVLYGLSGPTTLRFSADGFEARNSDVNITKTGPLSDLELTPLAAPTDIAGTWDVAFHAPSSCTTALSNGLTTRTATALVTQSSTFFDSAWLETATTSAGRVSNNRIRFSLSFDYSLDGYTWLETLSGGSYLAIDGSFDGAISGGSASGAFNGRFLLFPDFYAMMFVSPSVKCEGTDGSFTMTRRPI
jgi:hypothetical protein